MQLQAAASRLAQANEERDAATESAQQSTQDVAQLRRRNAQLEGQAAVTSDLQVLVACCMAKRLGRLQLLLRRSAWSCTSSWLCGGALFTVPGGGCIQSPQALNFCDLLGHLQPKKC